MCVCGGGMSPGQSDCGPFHHCPLFSAGCFWALWAGVRVVGGL